MPAVVLWEDGVERVRCFPDTLYGRRMAQELRQLAERQRRFVAWIDKASDGRDVPQVERR